MGELTNLRVWSWVTRQPGKMMDAPRCCRLLTADGSNHTRASDWRPWQRVRFRCRCSSGSKTRVCGWEQRVSRKCYSTRKRRSTCVVYVLCHSSNRSRSAAPVHRLKHREFTASCCPRSHSHSVRGAPRGPHVQSA